MRWLRTALVSTLLCAIIGCSKAKPHGCMQQLRLNFSKEPLTLDPRLGGDIGSSILQSMLMDGLTRTDKEGNIESALAKTYDISQDNLTYTFHLREAKWSDGTDVTSYDFEKAWKDILCPACPSPSANLFYCIKNAEKIKNGLLPIEKAGISAPDEKTFVIDLERPTPYFLELISFCAFFAVPHQIADERWMENINKHFVSNGPFQLTQYKKGDSITLKKNPLYWDQDQVKLDRINISLVSNEMAAYTMFERNEIDLLGFPFSTIPNDLIPKLKEERKLTSYPTALSVLCNFNTQVFPFNNTNIRQAFALAINRKEIIDHISLLDDEVAQGIVPPILKKHSNTSHFYEDNDIQKAKDHLQKGLDELGIKSDAELKIQLLFSSIDNDKLIAQILQQQWQKVLGVKIELECQELKVRLDRMRAKDFQCSLSKWLVQFNDELNILEKYKSKTQATNFTGWENAEYTELVDLAIKATDCSRRAELLEKAEGIFCEEMPATALLFSNGAKLQNPKLCGVEVSPIGSINIDRAYFVK